jgi:elongator complex protein 4
MAFRKRNIAFGRPKQEKDALAFPTISGNAGTRPSSLTTQLVTSTGTSSVDELLGGHGGLAFGSSILIEESGTTDFAGAIIRYYAAEGICHGHVLHVVGVGEGWIRELPGVAEGRSSQKESNATDEDRMKIAWRYEQLGQAGGRGTYDVYVIGLTNKHNPRFNKIFSPFL